MYITMQRLDSGLKLFSMERIHKGKMTQFLNTPGKVNNLSLTHFTLIAWAWRSETRESHDYKINPFNHTAKQYKPDFCQPFLICLPDITTPLFILLLNKNCHTFTFYNLRIMICQIPFRCTQLATIYSPPALRSGLK